MLQEGSISMLCHINQLFLLESSLNQIQIIYFHTILYLLTEEGYLYLFIRNAIQCICWCTGLPEKITHNPQKMLCILVSHAFFNHSTKCNKLWCLSSWKTRYKTSPWMCACNRTQLPWVQQGHPQPEQILQLACKAVSPKVILNWPKTPLFISWMERITYSTPFSSRMWNICSREAFLETNKSAISRCPSSDV